MGLTWDDFELRWASSGRAIRASSMAGCKILGLKRWHFVPCPGWQRPQQQSEHKPSMRPLGQQFGRPLSAAFNMMAQKLQCHPLQCSCAARSQPTPPASTAVHSKDSVASCSTAVTSSRACRWTNQALDGDIIIPVMLQLQNWEHCCCRVYSEPPLQRHSPNGAAYLATACCCGIPV